MITENAWSEDDTYYMLLGRRVHGSLTLEMFTTTQQTIYSFEYVGSTGRRVTNFSWQDVPAKYRNKISQQNATGIELGNGVIRLV